MLLQYASPGEDEAVYKKEISSNFIADVYLYDKVAIVYYNIRGDKPKLARPDLAWFESANKEKFDQRLVWWRCCIAGRTFCSDVFLSYLWDCAHDKTKSINGKVVTLFHPCTMK